jgi:L-arginine dehydrogenase
MTPSPLVLAEAEVAGLLDRLEVSAVMRSLFESLAAGAATQPPQTLALFPDGRGDFITYLGALAGEAVFGAKLSPYIPGPTGPLITAWTVLISMKTGRPLMLCDAGRLTLERTAGTTALAVDLLAPREATRLAVIGTGPVGLAHLRHAKGLRDWREIRLWSPGVDGRTAGGSRLVDGPKVCASLLEAVLDADVVMLCTSSAAPVLKSDMLTSPALVTSISTNAPRAHEVDPGWLPDLEVYCDHRATTPTVAGEMLIAAEAGVWRPEDVRGDLAELVSGKAPAPRPGRSVFFRSVGLGLEDIAMAAAIHRLARS